MASIGDLFMKVIADMSGFEADVTKGAAKTGDTAGKTLGTTIGKVTTKAFTAAGAVGGALFTGAIGGAANFEDQLRTINTVAKLSDDQLSAVGQSILDLSKETGKSTDDLTAGFYDLVSAGVPADKAISSLKASAVLATGALGTTGEAVDLVTSALGAYNIDASQSTKVTDIFAQAVADGKTTVADLAGGISQVAPIAASAGVSLEEVAAATAVMTLKGDTASQAMTRIKNAISALLTPNITLNEIQKRTGENFAQLAKDKGLTVALEHLRIATKGNQEEFAKALGSSEALTLAFATTGDNAAAMAAELDKVTTASEQGGVAQGQYDERMKSAKSTALKLVAGIRATALEIGGPYVDSLGAAVIAMNEMGGGMGGLVNLSRIFGGAIGAIGGFLVSKLGPKFLGVGKALGVKIAAGIAGSAMLNSVAESIASGSGRLATAGLNVGKSIGLKIAAGIAGSAAVSALSEGLAGSFAKVGGSSAVQSATSALGTSMGGKFGLAFQIAAVAGIAAIASVAAGPIQDIGQQIHQSILGSSNPLTDIGKAWQDWRKNTAWPIGQKDAPDWASLGGQVDDGLDTAIIQPLDRAADNASTAAEQIPAGMAMSIEGGKPALTAAVTSVAGGITDGKPAIAAALADVLKVTVPFGSDLAAKGKLAGHEMSQAIADGIKSARDMVAGSLSILEDALKNEMSPAKERATLLGQLTGDTLAKGLKSKDPVVKQAAENAKDVILQRLEQLIPASGKLGKKQGAELAKALKSKNPEVRAAAQKIKATIEAKLAETKAKKAGKAKGQEVADGIRSKKGAVGAASLALAKKVAATIIATIKAYGSGGGSRSQARALGGPVQAGVPYLVNENTPNSETFVPTRPGYILTKSDAMAAMAGTNGGSTGPTVHLNTYGLPMYAATPVEVGRQVRRAIKAGTPSAPLRRASWERS